MEVSKESIFDGIDESMDGKFSSRVPRLLDEACLTDIQDLLSNIELREAILSKDRIRNCIEILLVSEREVFKRAEPVIDG